MKLAGLMLLLAGWIIVVGAVVMLPGTAEGVFVFAGIVVQLVGLGLLFRSHPALRSSLR